MADAAWRRASVAALALVLVASGATCGSDGDGSSTADRPDGEEVGEDAAGSGSGARERPERPSTTSTTDPPPEPSVAEGDLPFVVCRSEDGIGTVADLRTIALDDKEERTVLSGLTDICNGGGSLTETQFTASRRYLVTLWLSDAFGAEQSIEIVDVASGEHVTVPQTALDAWATAQHGTGLGATQDSLLIQGFSRSGDGTFYFSRYDSSDGVTTYYSQALTDFVTTSGTVAPTALPDTRWCYRSINWSNDGTTCVASDEGAMDDYMLRSDLVEVVDDDWSNDDRAFDHELAYVDWMGNPSWTDADTLVGGSNHEVSRVTAGSDQTETLYRIEGDRDLTAWGHSPTGRIFLASPTLDGGTTEVYEIVPGSPEPVLFTTIPGDIAPIAL